nr:MAG TPA: tail fiber protein [Caudoviricetes sp.]
MALTLLAANNAQTVLAAGISSSATSMTVNTGTGVLFPSPVSGASFFKLTLIDAATGQITEIVHVTARSGDTMTISRGQEGTTARAWSANDIAANMMTAGTIDYLLTNLQPLDPTLTALASLTGTANKIPYFNGTDTMALTDLSAFSRTILSSTDSGSMQSTLGLTFSGTTLNFVSHGPGLMIQQGGKFTANSFAGNYVVVNFPQAFPNGCVAATAIIEDGNYSQTPFELSIVPTATNMTVGILSTGGSIFFNGRSIRWFAVGF